MGSPWGLPLRKMYCRSSSKWSSTVVQIATASQVFVMTHKLSTHHRIGWKYSFFRTWNLVCYWLTPISFCPHKVIFPDSPPTPAFHTQRVESTSHTTLPLLLPYLFWLFNSKSGFVLDIISMGLSVWCCRSLMIQLTLKKTSYKLSTKLETTSRKFRG